MKLKLTLMDESYKHSIPGKIPDFNESLMKLNCIKNSFAAFQVLMETDDCCNVSLTDAPSFSIYPKNRQLRVSSEVQGIGPLEIKMITPIEDDDGVLVDAGAMAQEAGFKWPVAITSAAWSDCVAWTHADSERQVHQDHARIGVVQTQGDVGGSVGTGVVHVDDLDVVECRHREDVVEVGVGQNEVAGGAVELLFHLFSKAGCGFGAETGIDENQAFVERDRRRPVEQRLGQRDVGAALHRVVLGQGQEHELGGRAGGGALSRGGGAVLVVAIDTATPHGRFAVADGGELLAYQPHNVTGSYADALLPVVDQVLAEAARPLEI